MYQLFIATPEKVIFNEEVLSLNAPGTEGYLEILTNHAPIITTLQPGKLTVTKKNKQKLIWAVSGGFLEFFKNKATMLVDSIETPSEIDLHRAETALKNAQNKIHSKDPSVDIPRAKESEKRAKNRIKIARETTKKTP